MVYWYLCNFARSGRGVAAVAVAAVVSGHLACSDQSGKATKDLPAAESAKSTATGVVGVEPELFKCESVASAGDVAALIGGKVVTSETAFEPARGTPRPCAYVRTEGEAQEMWSFDMDCRSDAVKVAGSLMKQYRAAGGNDAGVADVEVGRAAMDHHGQSLIFIDDDAPCYVRVHGPRAQGRLELARLIARNLTRGSAPMGRMYRK